MKFATYEHNGRLFCWTCRTYELKSFNAYQLLKKHYQRHHRPQYRLCQVRFCWFFGIFFGGFGFTGFLVKWFLSFSFSFLAFTFRLPKLGNAFCERETTSSRAVATCARRQKQRNHEKSNQNLFAVAQESSKSAKNFSFAFFGWIFRQMLHNWGVFTVKTRLPTWPCYLSTHTVSHYPTCGKVYNVPVSK